MCVMPVAQTIADDTISRTADDAGAALLVNVVEGDGADKDVPLLPQEQPKGKATTMQTLFNLANELEGAGLLGLPYTFRLGGWASAVCMAVCGVMAGWTGYCIAMCMYDDKGVRVRNTYRSVGLACYGRSGERMVFFMQMLNLTLVGVVFLVLVGSTLHGAHAVVDTHVLGIGQSDRRIWTAIATAVALPTVHVGGFHKISYLSIAGSLLLAVIVVVGVVASVIQIGQHGAQQMPSIEIEHIPAAFSVYAFAFSCHGIIPELESSMAHPEHFKSVVTGAFTVNMITKAIFALLIFFAYGMDTETVASSNFYDVPRVLVSLLVAVNTLLTFPMPLIPVFKAMIAAQGGPRAGRDALQRTALVLVCGVVAIAIPDFQLAMGFVGSFTLAFITFIFPTMFYIKLFRHRLNGVTIFANYLVAVVGVLGCVAGLASNINLVITGSTV